uniref:Chemokine interleukin-8-like domain-containing protein n=1 Tax=Neolamprologus brichardi TaxID=32507 RepID=A0A3Q4HA22_NEOBR
MNSVTAFIACLLILGAQGQPASKSNKCKCYSYIGRISPNIFCPHTEIIVTTKADMKKCVNPESPLGRHILKNHNNKLTFCLLKIVLPESQGPALILKCITPSFGVNDLE